MNTVSNTASNLNRGDHIEVDWLDIYADPTGDPRLAKLARQNEAGRFWELREDSGVRVLVTSTSKDEGSLQEGYTIYPICVVTKITLVKRARKSRKNAVKQVQSKVPVVPEAKGPAEG